jgi:hypothetical protein
LGSGRGWDVVERNWYGDLGLGNFQAVFDPPLLRVNPFRTIFMPRWYATTRVDRFLIHKIVKRTMTENEIGMR